MTQPRVVELTDLPQCEPNVSQSHVLAAGSIVIVIYDAKDANWPMSESWAVVRFDGCLTYQGGGPNDEAQHNHPFHSLGLKVYSLQEVLDSPWIEAQAALADKSGSPTRLMIGRRHFVLALKEDLFECIAKTYLLIGLYDSYDAAFNTASKFIRPVGDRQSDCKSKA